MTNKEARNIFNNAIDSTQDADAEDKRMMIHMETDFDPTKAICGATTLGGMNRTRRPSDLTCEECWKGSGFGGTIAARSEAKTEMTLHIRNGCSVALAGGQSTEQLSSVSCLTCLRLIDVQLMERFGVRFTEDPACVVINRQNRNIGSKI